MDIWIAFINTSMFILGQLAEYGLVNSLTPERWGCNLGLVIFKLISYVEQDLFPHKASLGHNELRYTNHLLVTTVIDWFSWNHLQEVIDKSYIAMGPWKKTFLNLKSGLCLYIMVHLQAQQWASWSPGGRLNKKDGLTRYGDSHVKDKTS